MPNPYRGEIEAVLNGERYTLCLTLGALAELENALGVNTMVALIERFENGQLKATDVAHIITAGLKGAGHDFSVEAVLNIKPAGGMAEFIDIAVRLLKVTFDA